MADIINNTVFDDLQKINDDQKKEFIKTLKENLENINEYINLKPTSRDSIAIIWTIDDVMAECCTHNALTIEEAREVLARAEDSHDAEIGINWEVLRIIAEEIIDERIKNDNE